MLNSGTQGKDANVMQQQQDRRTFDVDQVKSIVDGERGSNVDGTVKAAKKGEEICPPKLQPRSVGNRGLGSWEKRGAQHGPATAQRASKLGRWEERESQKGNNRGYRESAEATCLPETMNESRVGDGIGLAEMVFVM